MSFEVVKQVFKGESGSMLNRNEALRNMGIHLDQLWSRLGADSALQVGLDE